MAYEGILAQVPFFAGLPDEALGELAGLFQRQSYAAGKTIFLKGDPGSTFYLIMAGKVKIALPSPEGEEVLLALLSTGDFFGELSLFDGEPRSASAVTAEATTLLALDHRDFLRFVRAHGEVAVGILKVLSRRLRHTDELLADTAFLHLPARMAKRLLELASRYGTSQGMGVRIQLRLRQQDLANMVGATRESVNKCLRSFREEGLLEIRGGAITLADVEGLRRRTH